ncbi:hypothetical protein PQX77_013243 [Marasmius sp. AFHP31]|nr:hypothetical protein PQX77_013243 [Marasmius sp. AFHP31]
MHPSRKRIRKSKADVTGPQTFEFGAKKPTPTHQTSYLDLESFSSDGQRVQRQQIHFHQDAFSKRNQLQAFNKLNSLDDYDPLGMSSLFEDFFQLPTEDNIVGAMEDMVLAEVQQKRLTTKSASSVEPMQEWKAVASNFLDEIMVLDGRGFRKQDRCLNRRNEGALYRCRQCIGGSMLCKDCTVASHATRPFDVVEHNIGALWQQLLWFRLYPATMTETATAFSFELMSFFHQLTLQGKVNLFDYYKTIEKQTVATGTLNVKDRYEAFIRSVRQWQYLKQMKQAGVGNKVGRDLDNLPKGRVAVHCIACPRPGVNLPEDWQAMPAKRYLYQKFIAVDACFRLKCHMVSSEQKDPGLLTGLAYFVDQTEFRQWVPVEIPEDSTCPGLQAIDQASTKLSRGYAQMGAIICICPRHEVVEPNKTVDTTKGEKYCLTDYAIASSQQLSDAFLDRVLSYDICCQYCRRFAERMLLLPENLRMQIDPRKWQFTVPKLHIQGHIRKCQEEFAFHLMPGARQTDGEGIECHWSNQGPVASSTKEMGPGHRRDTLDDHFGHSNHNKNIGQGSLLRKRRQTAREQSEVTRREFREFNDSQDPLLVAKWKAGVVNWEEKRSITNPYAPSRSIKTEADIRPTYALEEAQELLTGAPPMHDVSPSAFMQAGFHVEELQRQLNLDLKNLHDGTSTQQVDIVERRGKIQLAMTGVHANEEQHPNKGNLGQKKAKGAVETVKLYLLSDLPESVRGLAEMQQFVKMELDFRDAQLETSLEGIRSHLFIRSRLFTQRSLHIRHQRSSRHAQGVMARNDRKVAGFKAKYQQAWRAVQLLQGSVQLPALNNKDVCSFDDIDMKPL